MGNLIMPQSSRRRRQKFNEQMSNYLKEQKSEKQQEVLMENVELSNSKEDTLKSVLVSKERTNKLKNDKLGKLDDTVFTENVRNVLSNLFAVIVYESLPLDDEDKELDADSIIEGTSNLFATLYENNTVVLSQSPTFRDYGGTVVKLVKNVNTALTHEQLDEILSTIFSEHSIDLTNTITNIYDKSANAIRDERDIKQFRDNEYKPEALTTNSNYIKENVTPTLFRKMNESHIEVLTEMDDINELDRKSIMDLSLAETILDMVVLETLHTTKLVEFDNNSVDSFVRF